MIFPGHGVVRFMPGREPRVDSGMAHASARAVVARRKHDCASATASLATAILGACEADRAKPLEQRDGRQNVGNDVLGAVDENRERRAVLVDLHGRLIRKEVPCPLARGGRLSRGRHT